MTPETLSPTKPFISFKEKRKFNWLVLGLLILIIGIGTISLMQAL